MKVHLLNGEVDDHPGCEARQHDGVLYVSREHRHGVADPIAAYPLTSVKRWDP